MECHARMRASQTERTFTRGLARERLGLFNGSPRKDKQQTFPLWYSPPSADCLSPRSCLVGRFLIELIYMVIGDFWVPLKEIQSNQSEFGVFFLLGQKRYLGNSDYGVTKKQKFLSNGTVTERPGCEFLFAGIVSISVVCSYPESQRRKRTQSCINTNLQPEHCAQERASRAGHLNSISSYIPRQKTEFTYYGFSMSIPNT